MKTKKYFEICKLFLYLSVFIILFVISSCNTDSYYSDEDCDDFICNSEEPFEAILYVNFTKNTENPNPKILLLEGEFEEFNVIDTLSTDEDKLELNVAINQFYTVVAYYLSGNDTIVAIDGDDVKKKSNSECGYECWKITDGSVNVKLKN